MKKLISLMIVCMFLLSVMSIVLADDFNFDTINGAKAFGEPVINEETGVQTISPKMIGDSVVSEGAEVVYDKEGGIQFAQFTTEGTKAIFGIGGEKPALVNVGGKEMMLPAGTKVYFKAKGYEGRAEDYLSIRSSENIEFRNPKTSDSQKEEVFQKLTIHGEEDIIFDESGLKINSKARFDYTDASGETLKFLSRGNFRIDPVNGYFIQAPTGDSTQVEWNGIIISGKISEPFNLGTGLAGYSPEEYSGIDISEGILEIYSKSGELVSLDPIILTLESLSGVKQINAGDDKLPFIVNNGRAQFKGDGGLVTSSIDKNAFDDPQDVPIRYLGKTYEIGTTTEGERKYLGGSITASGTTKPKEGKSIGDRSSSKNENARKSYRVKKTEGPTTLAQARVKQNKGNYVGASEDYELIIASPDSTRADKRVAYEGLANRYVKDGIQKNRLGDKVGARNSWKRAREQYSQASFLLHNTEVNQPEINRLNSHDAQLKKWIETSQ